MPRIFTCLLFGLALATSRAAAVVLWDAADSLQASAAARWTPKTTGGAVPARAGTGGVAFPLENRAGVERCAWDLPANIPHRPRACLEMEFTLDRPEAVRQLTVYIGNADGWRTASLTGLHRGWNRWTLPLARLSTEGEPGLAPGTVFRLVLWPQKDGGAALVQPSLLRVVMPAAQVVTAASPATAAADRANSARAAELLHDWLAEAGVAHGLLTDTELAAGLPDGCSTLLFAWQPRLAPAALAEASRLVKRGGRLVVCGSEDADLARLLDMERATAKETTAYGTYATVELKTSGDEPLLIHDHNWSIRPAKPREGAGRVLALWRNARGQTIYDPAISVTGRGWWLAFPFHAGDKRRKQDLLVRMLGETSPAVWVEAARTRLAIAQRAGPLQGVDGVRAVAGRLPAGRASALAPLLAEAETLRTAAAESLARGMAAHAYTAAARLEAKLDHAYALLQPPAPAGELRGVWDHNGVGLYPGGWDETCRRLAEAGFNAVFPNLMWSGKAHYRSRMLPASKTCTQFGDQLAAVTEASARHGLKCHVWKVCWQLGGTESPLYEPFRKAGRLQIDARGEVQPWLCPSQLENINWEVNALAEVAQHAGVAGIHLDYVRYPEGGGCFCPRSREAFEKYAGRAVARWPADAAPGGRDAELFTRFRADEITRFVGRVASTVKGVRPKVQVSAAVFGKYPACVASVAQDWARWVREGTVDFVVPMNYTASATQFAGWVDDQVALEENPARIVPGIGVISTECELSPDQVLEQIALARRRKTPGQVLFKLDPVLMDRVLPHLRPVP